MMSKLILKCNFIIIGMSFPACMVQIKILQNCYHNIKKIIDKCHIQIFSVGTGSGDYPELDTHSYVHVNNPKARNVFS